MLRSIGRGLTVQQLETKVQDPRRRRHQHPRFFAARPWTLKFTMELFAIRGSGARYAEREEMRVFFVDYYPLHSPLALETNACFFDRHTYSHYHDTQNYLGICYRTVLGRISLLLAMRALAWAMAHAHHLDPACKVSKCHPCVICTCTIRYRNSRPEVKLSTCEQQKDDPITISQHLPPSNHHRSTFPFTTTKSAHSRFKTLRSTSSVQFRL